MVIIINAIIAAIRLTQDSKASENKPTEPVKCQARNFSEIVATAAAIES